MGKHKPGKHSEEAARQKAEERVAKFEQERQARQARMKKDEEDRKRLDAARNVLPPKGWKGFKDE